jgi:hypothetical protein
VETPRPLMTHAVPERGRIAPAGRRWDALRAILPNSQGKDSTTPGRCREHATHRRERWKSSPPHDHAAVAIGSIDADGSPRGYGFSDGTQRANRLRLVEALTALGLFPER